jgi:hypothetical protein
MRTKKTAGGWLRSAMLVLEAVDTPAGFCKRLKFIFVILTTANWWCSARRMPAHAQAHRLPEWTMNPHEARQ